MTGNFFVLVTFLSMMSSGECEKPRQVSGCEGWIKSNPLQGPSSDVACSGVYVYCLIGRDLSHGLTPT